MPLIPPFPYFGGKRQIASVIWQALGEVNRYIEPFFGSGAILLARPQPVTGIEVVNDVDGLLVNFWRALQADPQALLAWAERPAAEPDLVAWNAVLRERRAEVAERLFADPTWYDRELAGIWLWGMCYWVGGGFAACGAQRKLPHVANRRGIASTTVTQAYGGAAAWLAALGERMRSVTVACGDWRRLLTPAVLYGNSPTTARVGLVLDPPYRVEGRERRVYAADADGLFEAVAAWAAAHGHDPRLRIVLCGYAGTFTPPPDWREVAWAANGGMSRAGHRGAANRLRERLWLSPACRPVERSRRVLLSV